MTTLRIDTMLYGGDGDGQTPTGQAVAIPFTLPGELVELPSNRILEPSPDRVAPACLHFGACGGCQYQHATYAAQLRIKEDILRNILSKAGLTDLPSLETHAGSEWHYRNRIRLRLAFVEGTLRSGYNQRSPSANTPPAFLPIEMCPLATPLLWRAAVALTHLAATSAPVAQRWLAAATDVELFSSADERKLQLTLFVRNAPAQGFAALCESLQDLLPELSGAGAAILPALTSGRSRRTERHRPGPTWGAEGLLYQVTEAEAHWVTRGAFFQINRFLIETLARTATEDQTGALAWDLYAGVGLFTHRLARRFQQVVAVEVAEPAVTDLARSLKGTNHRAIASTALDFLQSAVLQRDRPDLIIMDPPRAGIGPEVCALLGRLRTPKLVYVSCDPQTLARDLALLTQQNYRITQLHLVDMFPQTFHMETVAKLEHP